MSTTTLLNTRSTVKIESEQTVRQPLLSVEIEEISPKELRRRLMNVAVVETAAVPIDAEVVLTTKDTPPTIPDYSVLFEEPANLSVSMEESSMPVENNDTPIDLSQDVEIQPVDPLDIKYGLGDITYTPEDDHESSVSSDKEPIDPELKPGMESTDQVSDMVETKVSTSEGSEQKSIVELMRERGFTVDEVVPPLTPEETAFVNEGATTLVTDMAENLGLVPSEKPREPGTDVYKILSERNPEDTPSTPTPAQVEYVDDVLEHGAQLEATAYTDTDSAEELFAEVLRDTEQEETSSSVVLEEIDDIMSEVPSSTPVSTDVVMAVSEQDQSVSSESTEDSVNTESIETIDLENATLDEVRELYEKEADAVIPTWGTVSTREDYATIPLHTSLVDSQLRAIAPDSDLDSEHRAQIKKDALDNPNSFAHTLLRGTTHYSKNNSTDEAIEAFEGLSPKIGPAIKIGDKRYFDEVTDEKAFKQTEASKNVSGKAALHLAMALVSGIRKTRLYNSGISVTFRPPKKSELYEYVMKSRTNQAEFGRIFGELSYLPSNVEVVQAAMDLIQQCAVSSNLKDWNVPGTLAKHISYLDLPTCLWSLLTLMYPAGIPATMLCNKENCGHADETMVDPAKLRCNDYSRISAEGVKYTCSKEVRTPEDLEHYHKEILKDCENLTLGAGFFVDVHVPSIARYIEVGLAYVADLAAVMSMKDLLDVNRMVKNKYYRIFVPFIEKVSYKHESSGKWVNFVDPTIIPDVLDTLELKDDGVGLRKTMHKYILEKKISHFGYSYSACPKCGVTPEVSVNGIIPIDMLLSFFTHSMVYIA